MCFAAGGFGFLTFWWLFGVSNSSVNGIAIWLLCGYYIFFCLFFICSAIRLPVVMDMCGFLKHPLLKSLFYIL